MSAPVRAAALSITAETVEDFVDKMRNIAEGCLEQDKRSGSVNKSKTQSCLNCGVTGHAHRECRKEVKCFVCKKTGHRQYDCPLAKDKRQSQPSQQRTSTTPAVISEDLPQADQIAYVTDSVGDTLELFQSSVEVDFIEGRPCHLIALIDTGSSASFVKHKTYLKHCKYFP